MGRKQKSTLDSGSKKAAAYTSAYANHAFVSPTGMPAAYNYSSPPPAQHHPRTSHHPHFHSPPAPSSSMNHGNAVHNHFHQQNMPPGTSYPYSATPNHGNHHPPTLFSLASPSQQQPGNHHHPPQTNPIHMPNHIPAIDPTLIAVYLQHLNLSAAAAASAQQQRPHVGSHTASSMHAVPAVVSTASSVASAAEGQTAGHDGRSTGKFKRGEEDCDVTSTRVEMVQILREMGGRAKLTVETSNENFLTPAAYVQNTGTASIEAGGNAFFPADDGLDV